MSFVHLFLLEILQKYCRLVVLGTLVTRDYDNQNDGICLKETLILTFIQKIEFVSYLILAKISRLCYFGYFRHAWPLIPKQQYLPVGKFDASLHFFLKMLHFNNELSVWLVKSILTHNLRKILLSDKEFPVKYMTIWYFILDYFQEKLKTNKIVSIIAFKLLFYVSLY